MAMNPDTHMPRLSPFMEYSRLLQLQLQLLSEILWRNVHALIEFAAPNPLHILAPHSVLLCHSQRTAL
jgi:hypothetical protein